MTNLAKDSLRVVSASVIGCTVLFALAVMTGCPPPENGVTPREPAPREPAPPPRDPYDPYEDPATDPGMQPGPQPGTQPGTN